MKTLFICAAISCLGCPASDNGTQDAALVGSWRIYSERIDYEAGGGSSTQPVTTELGLEASGAWTFGSSNGTWSVETIEDADWEQWEIEPYGPTRKLVLYGWNDDVSEGPIEETDQGVDFFWVIYTVDEPKAGTIFMKFGH